MNDPHGFREGMRGHAFGSKFESQPGDKGVHKKRIDFQEDGTELPGGR